MLIVLAVLTGVMAGIYFTFSVFLIKAMNELPELQAAQAMNKINDVIVNTLFLPIFFGSTLWYAGLVIWALSDWQEQSSILQIIAALVYIGGMFVVTAFGNVPLNNRLKELESDDENLATYWYEYQGAWIRLNHIRTISCILALMILTISIQ
jgi:uncharacterized membrane protein